MKEILEKLIEAVYRLAMECEHQEDTDAVYQLLRQAEELLDREVMP